MSSKQKNDNQQEESDSNEFSSDSDDEETNLLSRDIPLTIPKAKPSDNIDAKLNTSSIKRYSINTSQNINGGSNNSISVGTKQINRISTKIKQKEYSNQEYNISKNSTQKQQSVKQQIPYSVSIIDNFNINIFENNSKESRQNYLIEK